MRRKKIKEKVNQMEESQREVEDEDEDDSNLSVCTSSPLEQLLFALSLLLMLI